ncbi:MAG TPA: hypothetical protein VFY65_14710 [Longimicrobium sp.]|nr:hypothetical protein [Longimicrobium sp.]
MSRSRSDFSNGSEITGVCSDPWYVQFTVTDSWGTKATRGQAFDCQAGYGD